jgi:hypothetical protein
VLQRVSRRNRRATRSPVTRVSGPLERMSGSSAPV